MSSRTVHWCGWCGEEPGPSDASLRPRILTKPTIGVIDSNEIRRHAAWSLDLCLGCARAWDALDMAAILARHETATGTTEVERVVRTTTP